MTGLAEHFKKQPRAGVISTASKDGKVGSVVYGSPKMVDEKTADLRLISSMIARGEPSTTIIDGWESFLKDVRSNGVPIDVNELVQFVLRESYIETTEDLRDYAEKIKFYNDMKRQMRDEISRIRESMEKYISSLEEALDGIEDDAQLANVDLQNVLQKQQQTLQQMSNISKMLHDTAMAVIRKIGG